MTGELRNMAFLSAERLIFEPICKGGKHRGIHNKTSETCGRVGGATWSAGKNELGGDTESPGNHSGEED